ncbi:ABC transporter substrate-binding protein [Rahnella selenatireducens]|uniref:ABC transporter substrate-binding protein n=1 Tax=Rahnella selenatireducens TaxID=3389797 RepID=UPI0039695C61
MSGLMPGLFQRRNLSILLPLALCASAQAQTVVKIATIANGDMTIMQQMSGEFEKSHPDIKLEWHVMDDGELRKQVLSDMNSGQANFDVITVGTYEAPLWGKKGWLQPLNNLPADYHVDDLLKPIRSALSWQGTLYALPFYGESSMTYYRKDLFAKKNLTMPKNPSWEEVKAFAAQLTDKSQGVYGLCLRGLAGWGDNVAFITTMANAYGAEWFDENWHPRLDSDEWRAVLTDYVQMMHDYGPPDAKSNSFGQNLKLFAQGKCAMWIDSTVAAGMVINPQISSVADSAGFAPAPTALSSNGSHWLWAWALAVPQRASHKDEAQQFITWATSQAYIQDVAKTVGWGAIPPGSRYSSYAQVKYQKLAPYADGVKQAVETATPEQPTLYPVPYQGVQYVSIPGFDLMGDAVGRNISNLLEGKKTLDETLSANQQVVTTIYAATSQGN